MDTPGRGPLDLATTRSRRIGRASAQGSTSRAAVLALAVWGLFAFPGSSSAHPQVQGPAKSCPEVQSIRVSEELEGDVLRDRAPESAQLSIVSAGTGSNATATVMAIGPVLGSIDSKDVETALACGANGVTVTATTTRSASYGGGVQKNVLWRPRLEIVLVPRRAGTVLTTTWKMRLTTGSKVRRTRMPPYPEMNYPVSAVNVIASDNNGNTRSSTVNVTVPHDQGN